ncbi:response regulator [Psychrobacter fozii]|uniref:Restriction endonuclease n=1 Tax=Psychrobacter fozii TaxID=198480 RepID=A0A2V4VH36_9GAMM|nr:response regulator [Psychrobacter fozii]PYE38095.1 restriction endonuclease [Psychrobacter fozii]
MKKTILIIDDEKVQVENLSRYLSTHLTSDYHILTAYEEEDILDKVNNAYYSLAILDLRMDNYEIDGISIAEKICDTNPFAKILITSAFTGEFYASFKDMILSGKIIDTIDKGPFEVFGEEVRSAVESYHTLYFDSADSIKNALLESYAECKNTEDTYQKGVKFEQFVAFLFNNMGFDKISRRNIDKSRNEVDLIIRNDLEDNFFDKFGKYFLVECKNMPLTNVDKNMFIIFKNKLENTASLSELGIIATTGNFTKTAYIEAVRESSKNKKTIFLTNLHFERLIKSIDRLETFKSFIDEQVKDN